MVEQWSAHSLRTSSKTEGGDLDEVIRSVLTKRFARFFTATVFTRYGWVLRILLVIDLVVMTQA
jgi:hypothetical protein